MFKFIVRFIIFVLRLIVVMLFLGLALAGLFVGQQGRVHAAAVWSQENIPLSGRNVTLVPAELGEVAEVADQVIDLAAEYQIDLPVSLDWNINVFYLTTDLAELELLLRNASVVLMVISGVLGLLTVKALASLLFTPVVRRPAAVTVSVPV